MKIRVLVEALRSPHYANMSPMRIFARLTVPIIALTNLYDLENSLNSLKKIKEENHKTYSKYFYNFGGILANEWSK